MTFLVGVFHPAQTWLAVRYFFFFLYRAIRFSFDRYKNSIATQVRSGSAILAYIVRAASWPISKPRRNEYPSVSISSILLSHLPFCLLTFYYFFFCSRARNPRTEVRHRGATERFSRRVYVSTYRSPICNEFLWKRRRVRARSDMPARTWSVKRDVLQEYWRIVNYRLH